MSKRNKHRKIEEQQEAALESLPESSASEETSEGEDAAKSSPAEEKQDEGFVEQRITDSEKRKLHERFRFDWEIVEELEEALDEDASELTEVEEPEPEPLGVRSISFAQAAQTVLGLVLLIFSIVGVAATCFKVADFVRSRNDNSEQIAYFEDFIMPLVASDAPIFDGAASLNEDVIITTACWDIIFNPSVYYEYSNGVYSVSYLDIDRRITKLYGAGLSYTHKSVGDVEIAFEYDEETGMYSIPAYPRSPAYYADITAISEIGGALELTVDYRLPITNWIDSVDVVEKSMIYTVVPTETDYNVTAIRIGEIIISEAN